MTQITPPGPLAQTVTAVQVDRPSLNLTPGAAHAPNFTAEQRHHIVTRALNYRVDLPLLSDENATSGPSVIRARHGDRLTLHARSLPDHADVDPTYDGDMEYVTYGTYIGLNATISPAGSGCGATLLGLPGWTDESLTAHLTRTLNDLDLVIIASQTSMAIMAEERALNRQRRDPWRDELLSRDHPALAAILRARPGDTSAGDLRAVWGEAVRRDSAYELPRALPTNAEHAARLLLPFLEDPQDARLYVLRGEGRARTVRGQSAASLRDMNVLATLSAAYAELNVQPGDVVVVVTTAPGNTVDARAVVLTATVRAPRGAA